MEVASCKLHDPNDTEICDVAVGGCVLYHVRGFAFQGTTGLWLDLVAVAESSFIWTTMEKKMDKTKQTRRTKNLTKVLIVYCHKDTFPCTA